MQCGDDPESRGALDEITDIHGKPYIGFFIRGSMVNEVGPLDRVCSRTPSFRLRYFLHIARQVPRLSFSMVRVAENCSLVCRRVSRA
jgi:hypothetical protein